MGNNITEQFSTLYRRFYATSIPELLPKFHETSKALFAQFDEQNRVALSDNYFTNFTPITNTLSENGQFGFALRFWSTVIALAKTWELEVRKKNWLHKGTPYYFAAAAAFGARDLDTAMILMNLALEEDKRNNKGYSKAPAYSFLTLNDNNLDQYLKPIVDWIVGFVCDRLDGSGNEKGRYKGHYNLKRDGTLSYIQLRQKFLDDTTKNDELKFYFVYSVLKIWNLRTNQKFDSSAKVVAPLIFAYSLGPFFLLIETLLKNKYPQPSTSKGNWDFGNVVQKLACDESWSGNLRTNLDAINTMRNNDFSLWVDSCLKKESLEGDFELVYGLRNFTFHKIQAQQKLWEKFTDVLQSVWNCFFKTLEVL